MWVNLFFAVSISSLLLLLISFFSLLAACCHRSKKRVDLSPESTSIEMVPEDASVQSNGKNPFGDAASESSSESSVNASTNPFKTSSVARSKNPFDEDSMQQTDASPMSDHSSTNPFSVAKRDVDEAANDTVNETVSDPVQNPVQNPINSSVSNPINNSINNPLNPFNRNNSTNPTSNPITNPLNPFNRNNSTNSINNPVTNPLNPFNRNNSTNPTNPTKSPTGLAALMGLADTSFAPTIPPKPAQSFLPQRDETPTKPERSPPQPASSSLSKPHRPAPTLDNMETPPMLPPKPVKPPKPAKKLGRTSLAGMRFVPCPEWMALTEEEKEKEETFLKRLSHRNIAKVGMMASCHVVCRVRKEGWKGLSGGGRRWTDLRNVPF